MTRRMFELIGRAVVGFVSLGVMYVAFLPGNPATPRWLDLTSSFILFMYGCLLLRRALGVSRG